MDFSSVLTASTMGLNKVLHMGRFHATSPGPLIGPRTQFMIALDFISKQHTMSPTKEPQSSILHVDHFLFNLFCLAEATGLIK